MARYQCGICGYIFDEDAEEKEFSDLEKCPVCGASMDKFRLVEESGGLEAVPDRRGRRQPRRRRKRVRIYLIQRNTGGWMALSATWIKSMKWR